jgi:hypothetical protein
MDMSSSVKKLGGMPSGFPFAMILIGAISIVAGAILGTIRDAYFFTHLGAALEMLGATLITAGAFLQGVRWVCEAFGRGGVAPPP